MTNLTVNPQIKVVHSGDTVIISSAYALIILCAHCGNVRNVYLHHTPTDAEMKAKNVPDIGTTQYSGHKYCRCDEPVAPNSGGGIYGLNEVYHAVEKCQTVDEALRMISYFMRYESGEQKEKTA
jgi:hypothetical protein